MMNTLFPDVSFFQTNVDSARYLISTIVQSEVAIIAIVFTLSLVAVQQTTSTYSSRVIDIFKDYKKNKFFFGLFATYCFCIAFSALMLKVIVSSDYVSQPIEYCIWIVYGLFISLIFVLIFYLKFTLNMFKPTTLIEALSENISKESIESAIKLEGSNNIDKNGQIKPINDTIQPIVDVLQGSMKSYDNETTRYGLKKIEDKAIKILSDERYNTGKEAIAKRIIDNIKIIGIIAAKQEMEKAVNDTVDTFLEIFWCLVDREIYEPIDTIISALFTIENQTIKSNLDAFTTYIFKKLVEIGIKSIDLDLNNITTKVIDSIARLTLDKISMENKQEIYQTIVSPVCLEAIESLGNICKKTAEKGWRNETSNLIYIFKVIGDLLIENTEIKGNAEFLLRNLLLTLESITQNLIKSDLKRLTSRTTSMIYLIGKKASAKNKSLTEESWNSLDNICSEINKCSPEVNGERDTWHDKLISEIMTQEVELNKLLERTNENIL